ncbi:hypothetical protein SD1617_4469 [Shigella dysenteriae 1617]|nr:hypothetical protein SD1617_4469 [Shigella dysenteriae 1617]
MYPLLLLVIFKSVTGEPLLSSNKSYAIIFRTFQYCVAVG